MSGSALYVGALLGPGVLLVPGLAVEAAGPASLLAWVALMIVFVPVVATFVALGIRHPVAGGAAEYVRVAFGEPAAVITGWWFLASVLVGAPAVALIGGFYLTHLAGGGHRSAVAVAACIFAAVLVANAFGIRASARLQKLMIALLAGLMVVVVATALPNAHWGNWSPFAPHGWSAVGTAGSILSFSFVGWEAVAFLVGEFRDPGRDLPRAAGAAWLVVSLLYVGLAVGMVGALHPGGHSRIPLADMAGLGLGSTGRTVTACAAVLLTMGTMNAYIAGAASLARSMATTGHLPGWLSVSAGSTPRRPLVPMALAGAAVLVGLASGWLDAAQIVRAISACFVAVYAASTAAGIRLLRGWGRSAAMLSFSMMCLVLAFFKALLLCPVAVGLLAGLYWRRRHSSP